MLPPPRFLNLEEPSGTSTYCVNFVPCKWLRLRKLTFIPCSNIWFTALLKWPQCFREVGIAVVRPRGGQIHHAVKVTRHLKYRKHADEREILHLAQINLALPIFIDINSFIVYVGVRRRYFTREGNGCSAGQFCTDGNIRLSPTLVWFKIVVYQPN